ncbi:MAG: mechanosensitive ion channel [Cyclobacteriaceae bacterium]|nr:mechanosensitive ion channel [Cyclobacteriaceae bacterium]
MENLQVNIKIFWQRLVEVSNISIFHIGITDITIGLILLFLLACILLLYLAKKIKSILIRKIFIRYGIEQGTSKSIGTIVYYFIISLGFFIIIQTVGIDLTGLSVVAGALGVGIGFGLQNITNNFISGIIILFERPIKEGDWIEIGDTTGAVTHISGRSTTVLTNDNISVIVPNSEFINAKVINWSHNDRIVRFNIPIGVSYNEDPEQIKNLLLNVADQHEGILNNPPPVVLFSDFGDSSLIFTLTGWTNSYIDKPKLLKSEINYAIHKIFHDNKIEIPFPQRDIHIKSESIKELNEDTSS